MHQGATQSDALRLAAGDLPGSAVCRYLDAKLVDQPLRPLLGLVPVKVAVQTDLGDVVHHRAGLVQSGVLKHEPEQLRAQRRALSVSKARHSLAVEQYRTGPRRQHQTQQIQKCRLAAS